MKNLLILFSLTLINVSPSFSQSVVKTPSKEVIIQFSSEEEKIARIKQLEAKIKIDLTDPTYPESDLQKEKEELENTKKAKVISTTK